MEPNPGVNTEWSLHFILGGRILETAHGSAEASSDLVTDGAATFTNNTTMADTAVRHHQETASLVDLAQLEDFITGDNSTSAVYTFSDGSSLTLAAPSSHHQISSTHELDAQGTEMTEPDTSGNSIIAIFNNPHYQQQRLFSQRQLHNLPDSPPDSSSEHPYSPPPEVTLSASAPLYTTLHAPSSTSYITSPTSPTPASTVQNTLLMTSTLDEIKNTTNSTLYYNQDNSMNGSLLGEKRNKKRKLSVVEDEIASRELCRVKMESTGGDNKTESTLPSGIVCSEISSDARNSQDDSFPQDPNGDTASIGNDESSYQCIKFSEFQQSQWHSLCDQHLTELPPPHYRVDADKGFNFSNADDAFVCQKKNHFQVTCHVQLVGGEGQFVRTTDGIQKVVSFHLHFYGVKHDCPTHTIRVEQSQSDRSKRPFHPVPVDLGGQRLTKVTVGRLHFSETTSNNMRKKGKPNPEQRYFQLVVGLHAHTASGNFPVITYASQKIIVRASNPGQFESDVELCWQKGQTSESICHMGRVGINTERPDESLVVHGNIKVTGHIVQPSDARAKRNIVECDPAQQLRNVQRLRVVRYDYEPAFIASAQPCRDTGVIAQEVAEVLPDAVRPAGSLLLANGTAIDDFLVVNKERIFMENIGAVKELCRVTDNLETRIVQLEHINQQLIRLKRNGSSAGGSLVTTANSTLPSRKQWHNTSCFTKHMRKSELGVQPPTPPSSSLSQLFCCSNQLIQIVIVVLVLVMAFCLAAITTLYLMEISRSIPFGTGQTRVWPVNHGPYITSGDSTRFVGGANRLDDNKGQLHYKTPDLLNGIGYDNWSTISHFVEDKHDYKPFEGVALRNVYTNDKHDLKITHDSTSKQKNELSQVRRKIIGGPLECVSLEQDLERVNLCQIYCCSKRTSPILTESVVSPQYQDRSALDYNQTNDISIQEHPSTVRLSRLKRQTESLAESLPPVVVNLMGAHFNVSLNYDDINTDGTNRTFSVPLSKYLADHTVQLSFTQLLNYAKDSQNLKMDRMVVHCLEAQRTIACPVTSQHNVSGAIVTTVTNNRPKAQQNTLVFDVDVANFQEIWTTFRIGLVPSAKSKEYKSICGQTESIQNLVQYNFHIFRHCDE